MHTYARNRGPTIAENRAAAARQLSQYRPDKVIADLTQLPQKRKALTSASVGAPTTRPYIRSRAGRHYLQAAAQYRARTPLLAQRPHL